MTRRLEAQISSPHVATLSQAIAAIDSNRIALSDHHVRRIGVFGSVARCDARPDSDVDYLVEFTDEGDLFELVPVKRILQQGLGCAVARRRRER